MSLEENKAIVRRLIEATNKHDLSSIGNLMAPDYVDHTRDYAKKGAIDASKMLLKAFPDYQLTIEDVIAEGDRVCVWLSATGTHTGEYLGLAPSGKKIAIRTVDVVRIADGKIVERKSVRDMSDVYKQLGVIEYTEKARKILPEDVA